MTKASDLRRLLIALAAGRRAPRQTVRDDETRNTSPLSEIVSNLVSLSLLFFRAKIALTKHGLRIKTCETLLSINKRQTVAPKTKPEKQREVLAMLRQKTLRNIVLILGITLSQTPLAEPAETVIALHGIAKSSRSMNFISEQLQSAGFEVLNLDYDSTGFPLETLEQQILAKISAQVAEGTTIHFVGHSMGGLLARSLAQSLEHYQPGRIVQLGSPNGGSEVADLLKDNPLFIKIYGPAGQQLTTNDRTAKTKPHTSKFDLGIIAGTRSLDPFSSLVIPGADDGKVAVSRTKVEGMTDHLEIKVSHPRLPHSDQAAHQTRHFLIHGSFDRSNAIAPQ